MRRQFQEFRTQSRTHAYSIIVLFPICVYVYALFFKINSFFFPNALLDASVCCHKNPIFYFKNCIIAIQLFLVIVLNQYLTSA